MTDTDSRTLPKQKPLKLAVPCTNQREGLSQLTNELDKKCLLLHHLHGIQVHIAIGAFRAEGD